MKGVSGFKISGTEAVSAKINGEFVYLKRTLVTRYFYIESTQTYTIPLGPYEHAISLKAFLCSNGANGDASKDSNSGKGGDGGKTLTIDVPLSNNYVCSITGTNTTINGLNNSLGNSTNGGASRGKNGNGIAGTNGVIAFNGKTKYSNQLFGSSGGSGGRDSSVLSGDNRSGGAGGSGAGSGGNCRGGHCGNFGNGVFANPGNNATFFGCGGGGGGFGKYMGSGKSGSGGTGHSGIIILEVIINAPIDPT